MNDKFASQLRQHLLNTAEERPADGQLAAVAERLAVTTQRRPLVARLTWNPGRVGPFPTAALRFGVVAVALIAALMAAALYVGGGPKASTVFEGTWTSIDPGDDSTQTLDVAAGTSPAVQFVDHFATGLACRDDAVKVFKADGQGTITGNQLGVVFADGGGCGSMVVAVGPATYTYDPATDTIVDDQGLTWTRVPDGFVPPTPGPTPAATPLPTPEITAEPVPTAAATPEPTEASISCTQFDAEGLYTANAGTLPVGVIVPATASSPWSGLPDEFALTNASCGGSGSVTFTAGLVAHIYADSCHWRGSSVEAPTVPDLVARILTQPGHETSDATETHVGAFRATRLDLSVPADFVPAACDDGVLGLWETKTGMRTIDPATTIQVYVAEVDGVTLVLTAGYRTADATPDLLAEIDAILASLRIDM